MTQLTIEASRRAGQRLSRQEASAYWARETLKVALEHPAAFLGKIFQKTLVFFNQFEAGDHYDIGFVSQFVNFFKLPFIPLSVIFPLGIAGMVLSAWRFHKFLCVGLVFVFYASTLILFFTSDRFRLPLLVILIPFAVMGIKDLLSWVRVRQWRRVFAYSGIAIALFVIEFLPVQGTGDMTTYYNTHAIILDTNGRENEALQYWEASSKMERPSSAFANLSLAGKALGRRDIQKALGYLDKIPDASFAAAYKYDLMGDMMMAQGQIAGAIAAYERSLDINSGQRGPRRKLVKLYWRVDREKALREFETLEYISSFYDFLQTPASGGGSRNRNDSVTGE
jgi:tetratricopeptide (TPR) repeat protein